MNWIFAVLKADLSGTAFHLVAANHCLGEFVAVTLRLNQRHPRNRAPNHGRDVRMPVLSRTVGGVLPTGVGAGSLPFATCDQQLATVGRHSRRIPLRGNRSEEHTSELQSLR